MIGEAIGGYLSHSLSILTDAAHMFSDVTSFMISYFAIYLGKYAPNNLNTFGYGRAEILGAMTSVVFIWALVIWLLVEATHRIVYPEEIDGKIMLITACVGFICNVINLFTLHSCGEDGVP
jgi:zinc transporter 2